MNKMKAKLEEVGADGNMKDVLVKLKGQWTSLFDDFGGFFVAWFDKLFPPETREEVLQWLKTAAPYIISALILLLCLWCCSCCFLYVGRLICYAFICLWNLICFVFISLWSLICYVLVCLWRFLCFCWRSFRCCFSYFFNCCRRFFRFICCCGQRVGKMMKAPGRSAWIQRSAFESNPGSYFRGLRAGAPVADFLSRV